MIVQLGSVIARRWHLASSTPVLRRIAAMLRSEALRIPLLAFLASRATLLATAYVAEVAIDDRVGDAFWHARPDNLLLDVWARWDSGFYLTIIESGYRFLPGEQSNVAFFPLYPLLTTALARVVGDPVLAGVLVSHVFFLAALLLLYRLTAETIGPRAASTATLLLAFSPVSFFFSAVYTESLYTTLAIGVFYLAHRKAWGWAAVVALLASATRIPGLVLWGVLGLAWLRSHGWTLTGLHRPEAWRGLARGLRNDPRGWTPLLLPPLGLLTYAAFLARETGDAIAFWTVQAAWGRESLGPIAVAIRDLRWVLEQDVLAGGAGWAPLADLPALLAVVVLSLVVWRRFGAGYGLYVLFGVLIPAASGSGSMLRYALVLFPLAMLLADALRDPRWTSALIGASATAMGMFTALFVNWYFVA
jgi:hypothetical protein